MTLIIAHCTDTHSYILGDSAAVAVEQHSIGVTSFPKVWKVPSNKMLIGYTSSFRMGQILQHYMSHPPDHLSSQSDMEYMATTFTEEAMTWLEKAKYARTDSGHIEGGVFIVVYNGKAYKIQSEFSVLSYDSPTLAVGSGAEISNGIMRALEGTDMKPKAKLLLAAQTTAEYNITVRAPFTILKTPIKKKSKKP